MQMEELGELSGAVVRGDVAAFERNLDAHQDLYAAAEAKPGPAPGPARACPEAGPASAYGAAEITRPHPALWARTRTRTHSPAHPRRTYARGQKDARSRASIARARTACRRARARTGAA